MEAREDNQSFSYTYSAKQQEEIKKIRKKYATEKEDKMEQLRRLDESVSRKAVTASLIVGIIGALILGLGMSLAMSELKEILGTYSDIAMLLGIAIGIIGIALVVLAYPIYNRTLKKEREKAAPQILKLTDELMK